MSVSSYQMIRGKKLSASIEYVFFIHILRFYLHLGISIAFNNKNKLINNYYHHHHHHHNNNNNILGCNQHFATNVADKSYLTWNFPLKCASSCFQETVSDAEVDSGFRGMFVKLAGAVSGDNLLCSKNLYFLKSRTPNAYFSR